MNTDSTASAGQKKADQMAGFSLQSTCRESRESDQMNKFYRPCSPPQQSGINLDSEVQTAKYANHAKRKGEEPQPQMRARKKNAKYAETQILFSLCSLCSLAANSLPTLKKERLETRISLIGTD